MNTVLPGFVRTYVPLIVGALVTWLAGLGIQVGDDAQLALTTGIGAVAAAVYYAAIRWAEAKWPAIGVLLGSAKQPVYVDALPGSTGTTANALESGLSLTAIDPAALASIVRCGERQLKTRGAEPDLTDASDPSRDVSQLDLMDGVGRHREPNARAEQTRAAIEQALGRNHTPAEIGTWWTSLNPELDGQAPADMDLDRDWESVIAAARKAHRGRQPPPPPPEPSGGSPSPDGSR